MLLEYCPNKDGVKKEELFGTRFSKLKNIPNLLSDDGWDEIQGVD